MIKCTNQDLEAVTTTNSGYDKLYKTEFDDILITLELNQQREQMQPFLKAYQDTKKALAEKYCDKDESGKPKIGNRGEYTFYQNPANLQKFQEKLNELLEAEVEMSGVSKVTISAKELRAARKWSADDMGSITKFINIKKEEATPPPAQKPKKKK